MVEALDDLEPQLVVLGAVRVVEGHLTESGVAKQSHNRIHYQILRVAAKQRAFSVVHNALGDVLGSSATYSTVRISMNVVFGAIRVAEGHLAGGA